MTDNAALRRSVELERLADLAAAGCDFGRASGLMKEANLIRSRELGLPRSTDPNHLRDLTMAALEQS